MKAEVIEIADKIYSDVIGLEVTNDKKSRIKIAVLIAESLKKSTNDGTYQSVINELKER